MRAPAIAPLAAVVTVLVSGLVVGAFAYFTSASGGSGHIAVGVIQPVNAAAFTGGDAPSSALLPGRTADVIVRIDNPNSYTVTLVSVTRNGAITADAGHPGCTGSPVTFADQAGLAIAVPPGSSLVHLPGAASMSLDAASACQGATFAIPVASTVNLG